MHSATAVIEKMRRWRRAFSELFLEFHEAFARQFRLLSAACHTTGRPCTCKHVSRFSNNFTFLLMLPLVRGSSSSSSRVGGAASSVSPAWQQRTPVAATNCEGSRPCACSQPRRHLVAASFNSWDGARQHGRVYRVLACMTEASIDDSGCSPRAKGCSQMEPLPHVLLSAGCCVAGRNPIDLLPAVHAEGKIVRTPLYRTCRMCNCFLSQHEVTAGGRQQGIG